MTKRLLLCLAVVILITLMAPISVSAENADMDKATANEFIESAVKLFTAVNYDADEYVDNNSEPLVLDRNGTSVKYYPAKAEYSEYSFWENWAKSIYTEDIYEYAIELGKGTGHTLGLLINHNGKAYFLDNNWCEDEDDGLLIQLSYYFLNDAPDAFVVTYSKSDTVEVTTRISFSTGRSEGGAARPLIHYTLVSTEDGWRISGGSLLNWICPAYENKEGNITPENPGDEVVRLGYVSPVYPQVIKPIVERELSELYGFSVEIDTIKVYTSSAHRIDSKYPRSTNLYLRSEQINNNKPFGLCLTTDNLFDDNWKVDLYLSSGLERHMSFAKTHADGIYPDIDQTPIIELYNFQNPDTSDVTPPVAIACVFLFMLSVVVDKRKWIFR